MTKTRFMPCFGFRSLNFGICLELAACDLVLGIRVLLKLVIIKNTIVIAKLGITLDTPEKYQKNFY